MANTAETSTWDVHIGHLPPGRWDELDLLDSRARRALGGNESRPDITSEPIAWDSLAMSPRWVGDDSSEAVAAIEPSLLANRGADEWRRFRAGTRRRAELTLAISMVGRPEEPEIINVFGPSASISLPGAALGFATVGGPRIALANHPAPAGDLATADRDLALRVVNVRDRDRTLPWWSLQLHGSEVHHGGGGASQIVNPTGTLLPLLVSTAGEVVAAIWISPDDEVRHYVLPWLPAWTPVLRWLSERAVPELMPAAARRLHARLGEEVELQTADELAASVALNQLDQDYQANHHRITERLRAARVEADEVRHSLLYGTGAELEAAVVRVLRDSGIEVVPLDAELGRPASADLLATLGVRRRLVEVKSASGNPSEALVATARKHLTTWPELQPAATVEGITLVVNHRANVHPFDRPSHAFERARSSSKPWICPSVRRHSCFTLGGAGTTPSFTT